MLNIYNANGFTIKSDTELYGWSNIQHNEHCLTKLKLVKAQFNVNYDGISWPYIYLCNSFIYFVWYRRIAIRVSKDFALAEYMLSIADYENEITFALNFILAFIAPFVRRLALHGCAVATDNNEALLILGDSGIGKSTLLRKLLDNGYNYLSEEVAFINSSNKTVYQSNKLIRIKSESYNKCQGDKLLTVVGDKTSFWNSNYTTMEQEAKLKSICIIQRDTLSESGVKELSKAETVKYLLGDYLYVKKVLQYVPFVEMVDMVTRVLSDTRTILYKTADFPNMNIITKL